ncbi:OmpA family protein [Nitrosomonas sp. Nm132]|jgi:OOP family OmpA-OmpF porin|uniref:OmpA family protein n=1 Tax=Nitrosomonas sp. Nm132 TaxID=1881053 RepID=UPI000881F248|nr:OmpA family protein [Nitrosomonas sp. Nm132]SDH67583.1 OmpA-OmpF porin, OOP family [Nitrosomonas sp. Nm132]
MKKIVSTRKYLIGVLAVLSALLFSTIVTAESPYRQGESDAEKVKAYNVNDRGAVSRSSADLGNLCWRTREWNEETATCECDPQLPKCQIEKKVEAPAPAPAPLTEPEKISFSADALFDFDKAVLKPEGKQSLSDFADKLANINYDLIIAVGYADRIGSEDYNKQLSMRRAEAVKNYLVTAKGISPDRIFTDGKGEANPITGDSCPGTQKTKALINCLAPDRRVEIEVAGTR